MIKINQKLNCPSPINYSFKRNKKQNSVLSFGSETEISHYKIPSDRFARLKDYCLNTEENESIKRKMNPNLFFIRMQKYGKDYPWALNMSKIALELSQKIKEKKDFDEILNYTCSGVRAINHLEFYGLRNEICVTGMTLEKGRRGEEYLEKYRTKLNEEYGVISPETNEEYKEALTSLITFYKGGNVRIEYGYSASGKSINLKLCKKAYEKLISNDNPTEKDILDTCATIQWLISQGCPFWKGNDSIANLLTKAIMHCYGMELSQIKKGHSLDFEAFYRDLDDYIEKYPTFFEKYPKKR